MEPWHSVPRSSHSYVESAFSMFKNYNIHAYKFIFIFFNLFLFLIKKINFKFKKKTGLEKGFNRAPILARTGWNWLTLDKL
jgi:hypothetical protein